MTGPKYTVVMSRLLRLLSVPLMGVLLVGCFGSGKQSTIDPASEINRSVLFVYKMVTWIDLGILVVVFGLLAIALIRFRSNKTEQEPPKQVHGNPVLELMWTLIPALLLILISVPTWQNIFLMAEPPEENAFHVRAIGKQWWWEFEYTESGAVTANELHVPVNRPIIIETFSTDVIHAFWVPRLSGKIDSLPGQKNMLWFVAEETGTYYGQCAEFCGTSHANMRFRVIVQEQEEFDKWMADLARPPAPQNDDARAGQGLFASKGCVACHTINGVPGAVGRIGPNLNNLGNRTTIASAIIDNTPDNLARWIREPRSIKPGALMVLPLPVSEAESRQLAAYLTSPPAEASAAQTQPVAAVSSGGGAPSAAQGQRVYMQTCVACHGPDPTKDGAIGPAIAGSSEALIRARVMFGSAQYGKSYPPGYSPKRATRMMTPFPHLKDDIDDLAAYLNQ